MSCRLLCRFPPIVIMALVCCIVSNAMPVARAEAPAAVASTAPAEPADMQQLFDGKDLDGWDGDPRLWSVRDGVIHAHRLDSYDQLSTTQQPQTKGETDEPKEE